MNNRWRIGIVAGILLVIAGIWFVKNTDSEEPVAEQEPALTEAAVLTEKPAVPDTEPVDVSDAAEDDEAGETTEEQTEAAAQKTDPDLSLQWTTHDFDTLVSYNKPMILDFGADECGPCQVMAPDLEAFHAEYKEKATIQYYDVWEDPKLAADYPIQVVPTQLFFLPDGTPYDPGDRMNDSGIRFTLYYDRETDEHGLTAHVGILNKEQLELILADMESLAQ